MGCLRLLVHDMSMSFYHWRTKRRDPIPLWNTAIKSIEGQFGGGIASFFVFIRYVTVLPPTVWRRGREGLVLSQGLHRRQWQRIAHDWRAGV